MEVRKITVVLSQTQRPVVIESGAENLGELKRDLANAGVSFDSDASFLEGNTGTELKFESSVLPTNVMRRGATEPTNELLFMVTNTGSKIKSGATKRQNLFDKINEYGLQDSCKALYGHNYTLVSDANLAALIDRHEAKINTALNAPQSLDGIIEAIRLITETLYYTNAIDSLEKRDILNLLAGAVAPVKDTPYSQDEINDAFAQFN